MEIFSQGVLWVVTMSNTDSEVLLVFFVMNKYSQLVLEENQIEALLQTKPELKFNFLPSLLFVSLSSKGTMFWQSN